MTTSPSRTAIVTGASAGLGRALASALVTKGWSVFGTARRADPLQAVAAELGPTFVPVVGDVADATHRRHLVDTARATGRVDLLINNASTLGTSPLPPVADLDPEILERVLAVNVVAPAALVASLLPDLRAVGGTVVNLSSDAAVEAYPTWAGYGSSKAALDHLSAVLAAEERGVHVYAVDPGDMRTDMHQAAFPGEDISDRPEPEASVPAILALIDGDHTSGRYRATEVVGS